jgi:hypothetical protein
MPPGSRFPEHVQWPNVPGQKKFLQAYKKHRSLISMTTDDLKNHLKKPKGNGKLLDELELVAHSEKEAEDKWFKIVRNVKEYIKPKPDECH